jgi:hypothetical protein
MKMFQLFLRIAAAAFCGIACVLLIALWVRSYWWADGITGPLTSARQLLISSSMGTISVRLDDTIHPSRRVLHWQLDHFSIDEFQRTLKAMKTGPIVRTHKLGFLGDDFLIPQWLPVFLTGSLAIVLGVKRQWRFSLRALVFASTLTAIVLWVLVWVVH